MDQSDAYRKNAADAQARADQTKLASDKEAWLRIAQGWLSLIPLPGRTATEKFDDQNKAEGTGQEDSTKSH